MKYWMWVSVVISALVTGLAHYFKYFSALTVPEVRSAAGVAAQIAGTMLGFMIAALSILASISGARLVKKMREYGHYKVLLKRLYVNSVFYGLALVFGCFAIISPIAPIRVASYLTFLSFLVANLLLVDVGYRFWLVLMKISEEDRN